MKGLCILIEGRIVRKMLKSDLWSGGVFLPDNMVFAVALAEKRWQYGLNHRIFLSKNAQFVLKFYKPLY